MNKIRMLCIALSLATATGWGQGLSYNKIDIRPSTHLVVAGNTHLVLVDMNFRNDGFFNPGQGTVHFIGARSDTIGGSSATTFFNLIIDKGGSRVNFYIPPELPFSSIDNLLTLQGAGSHLVLYDGNLAIGADAGIQGAGNQNFIVTAGKGSLIKIGLTNFTFPIGPDPERFNPIRVQSQQAENIGVRCLPHVLSNGLQGNALSRGVVDVSWALSKSSDEAVTLTPQWRSSDELPDFDGKDCGVSRSLGNGDWDLAGANIGEKAGDGLLSISRSNITSGGVFAVGSEPLMYPLRVSLKAFLQGAFNAGTGRMTDNLRALGLLPLTEPYGQSHVGRGGGETVSQGVFSVTGPKAVTDWVLLELRTGSTVLETRSALILSDGSIVDIDGVSPVAFLGREAGSYFLAVRHRNHIGIRSFRTLNLSNEATLFNFTSEAAQAFGSVQAALGNAGWGMYGGNANSNNNVRYAGPNNDQNALLNGCLGGKKTLVLSNVYNHCDLNLNGVVRYTGPLNDQNFLLNTVLGGDKTKVITQPNF